MKKHTFTFKGASRRKKRRKTEDEDSNDGDLDEDEVRERDEEDYIESDASKVMVQGDIVVIKTSDDYPYYLLQLTDDPFETENIVSDDYGHFFPPNHRVMKGHYLEIHKNIEDGLYYLDVSNTAVISAFSIVGTCPELTIVKRRRRGEDIDMFLVEPHLHQGLCELVNCYDM